MIPDEQQALRCTGSTGAPARCVAHCETVAKVSLKLVEALRAGRVDVDGDAISPGRSSTISAEPGPRRFSMVTSARDDTSLGRG